MTTEVSTTSPIEDFIRKHNQPKTDQLEPNGENKKSSPLTGSSQNLGKQDFLHLLVTQLKFQDPMKPMENTEFVAQLAQFTSLETSRNIDESIGNLGEKMDSLVGKQQESAEVMRNSGVTSMLGRVIRLKSDEVSLGPEGGALLKVRSNQPTSIVRIYDARDNEVGAFALKESGEHLLEWDGKNAEGKKLPSGTYTLKVESFDGKTEAGYAFVEDIVKGISYSEDGIKLTLNGRQVPMQDVMEVSLPE